ncbi:twin-arginine translocase subunit TatC [Leptospira sp. GIMC2001]|uniref:twin-arginine translocase subunit TatC n=1 Tax=Leptospira sp. GIMC2001 TaxID=1513297 RepID=UPI00234A65E6|nr:twin-arginine translocase subunit TatC [Leptospira sp. GIMC2001]WCL48507.1 twin-arginine translocase subunit TatC [Leptospira sp. GIMC2001]
MSPTLKPEESVPIDDREKFMTLGDHLEELRQRLIWGMGIVFIFTAIALVFGAEIHTSFIEPYRKALGDPKATFYQIKLMAPFLIYLKTAFMLSILIAFPFLFYILWGFVAPALDAKTERMGIFIIVFSTILFWSGIALCWFTVFENFLKIFLITWMPEGVEAKLPIDEYYDLFFNLHLIFGISFQLPVLLVLLGRLGIVKTSFLINRWREIIIGLAVFAAIFSPGPDVVSMLMLFGPLVFLFAFSLGLMKFLEKRDAV